jgi:WD40 repeat protein
MTDLKYSNAGDRILTASMKDGVVRVWSWGKESAVIIDGHSNTATTSDFKNTSHAKFTNISNLMIRLTPVQGDKPDTAPSSRRRGLPSAASSSSSVHCDGVTWTCDDTKIVTSQSSPAKANGSDIVPGSHMLYVWDSSSGRCLLGILGSHTALCSTIVAHPFIPSVVVSAGSDGIVNVWDLNSGKSFCTHENILTHGPTENGMSRGKQCSYLEGQFSPDGSYLILSDESGRVTLFDTMTSSSNRVPFDPPSWMLEQYFANDYYELFYDSNGYCIERGSERPPHLAPKGVRCSHEGVGVAEDVRTTYTNLAGPRPLPPNSVRWSRSDIRNQSFSVRRDGGLLSRNVRKKSSTLVESPGVLFGCKTTAIVSPNGKLVEASSRDQSVPITFGASGTGRTASSTTSGRPLSNRYTWVDFNDIADEEDEFVDDGDDEEYLGEGHRLSRGVRADNGDVSSDDEVSDEDADSPAATRNRRRQGGRSQRRSTGQRNRQVQEAPAAREQVQPSRTSSRQNVRRTTFESDDEESVIEEFLSTHTKPSGEYVQDWEEADHFFKMPRDSIVHRKWVTRTNDQGAHYGMKIYCPQVGDSVVYIPRAHYDTLQRYPTGNYTAPWKSWPTSQSWPVVRCRVKHVRYRFPYQMYYFKRRRNEGLNDVAIILTLEITGVPIICGERRFPWPPPKFTSPVASRTRSHDSTFEVTMFDSGVEDFILPEFLYCWRIRELEKAIEKNGGSAADLSVTVNYPPGVFLFALLYTGLRLQPSSLGTFLVDS